MKFPAWLPVLLGFLSAVGPVSTDMYLPAFPAIEASLGGVAGTAQITLAAWFAGLALGQITQGSLADRCGRRTPLILGTALYTLASAGCALAPGLVSLSAFRLLAAFGGSASIVIPRAIVRDLADGHEAARLMSRLILVMGAAPILAPTLGGVVLGLAGWHAIFWFCALYGAIGLTLVLWKLPDTLAPRLRVRLGPGAMLSRFVAIATERGFLSHALMGGFGMFGMFAYVGGSPVLIRLYGIPPVFYGMMFGACAAGFIAAAQVGPLLLPRFGASRILHVAVLVYLAASLMLVVCAATGLLGLAGIVLPVFVSLASMGLIMPNATVGALSRHAAHAGSASALMGTLQFLLAAGSGLLVGLLANGTPLPFALLVFAGAAGAAIADRARPRPS